VEQLPDPAEVASCESLTATARDFIHAAAAVAVADESDEAAGELSERVRALGDGYASRTVDLACDEQAIVDDIRSVERPGNDASVVEIVEYLLSGGEFPHPSGNPSPVVVNNGPP
jgi:hypothetical protein